jgi:hypothetical protein
MYLCLPTQCKYVNVNYVFLRVVVATYHSINGGCRTQKDTDQTLYDPWIISRWYLICDCRDDPWLSVVLMGVEVNCLNCWL